MINSLIPLLSFMINPDWTVTKDVQYGKTIEEKADLYLLNSGVRPAVVFIHGGGWMAGDKSVYEGRAKKYALAGFHTFSINYRLAKTDKPETQWSAQIQDAQHFMRWLRANAVSLRIDPNRIAVCGDSAGGHLSLLLGSLDYNYPGDRKDELSSYSSKAAAVVNMFGPSDLSTPEMLNVLKTTAVFNYGAAPADASPINSISYSTSPVCTIHGTKDLLIPFSQATNLKNKLDQYRIRNILISYDGGHNLNEVPWYVQQYLDLRGLWFLTGILKP